MRKARERRTLAGNRQIDLFLIDPGLPDADDFVAKPFGVAELHARLRVALRRARQTTLHGTSALRLGTTAIDLSAKTVQKDGVAVRLTATQWRLLEVLCRHVGRVVTSQQLLNEVWRPGHADQAHYLRIYVRQ